MLPLYQQLQHTGGLRKVSINEFASRCSLRDDHSDRKSAGGFTRTGVGVRAHRRARSQSQSQEQTNGKYPTVGLFGTAHLISTPSLDKAVYVTGILSTRSPARRLREPPASPGVLYGSQHHGAAGGKTPSFCHFNDVGVSVYQRWRHTCLLVASSRRNLTLSQAHSQSAFTLENHPAAAAAERRCAIAPQPAGNFSRRGDTLFVPSRGGQMRTANSVRHKKA